LREIQKVVTTSITDSDAKGNGEDNVQASGMEGGEADLNTQLVVPTGLPSPEGKKLFEITTEITTDMSTNAVSIIETVNGERAVSLRYLNINDLFLGAGQVCIAH
jgi:hypothetical protein